MRKAVQNAYRVVDSANQCDINGKSGEHVVSLSNVAESQEALPICVTPAIMAVHFTPVIQEVVHKEADLLDLDDDNLTEFPASASFNDLRVRQMIKISVTYDIQMVDEMTAAQFLAKIRFYLNDPEMMLL